MMCYYYYSTIGKVLFIYFLCLSHFLQAACQSTITVLFYVSVLQGRLSKLLMQDLATLKPFAWIRNSLLALWECPKESNVDVANSYVAKHKKP